MPFDFVFVRVFTGTQPLFVKKHKNNKKRIENWEKCKKIKKISLSVQFRKDKLRVQAI